LFSVLSHTSFPNLLFFSIFAALPVFFASAVGRREKGFCKVVFSTILQTIATWLAAFLYRKSAYVLSHLARNIVLLSKPTICNSSQPAELPVHLSLSTHPKQSPPKSTAKTKTRTVQLLCINEIGKVSKK